MPTADRSHTERTRRVRALAQAARRAACPSCPEEFPKPTDQSTWLSRRFGQAPYFRQIASGAVVSESCCEEVPAPCALCDTFIDYDVSCSSSETCDKCCYRFSNPLDKFTVSLTIGTVSGISLTVSIPPGGTYPPAYLNKGIPNILYFNATCYDIACGGPIFISDPNQSGDISGAVTFLNSSSQGLIIALSNSAGACTPVFLTSPKGAVCVNGATHYAAEPAPSPPTPTCVLCDASGDPLQMICNDSGFCGIPDGCCTQFTNTTGQVAQLSINTVSGINFSVEVAQGESYPPLSLNKAIPNITDYSVDCVGVCAVPSEFISITDIGQTGPVTSSYIKNDFMFSVVVSLSDDVGACTPVFIPSGGYVCRISGAATQYSVGSV